MYNTEALNYSLPKNLIWSVHIAIGLFFVAVAAVYLSFKDKDPKDVPFNVGVMNEAVYVVILILGSLMVLYHGHLMAIDKGLLSFGTGEGF